MNAPIVFEDQSLLIINKPSGLPVLPERWQPQAENLLQMIVERFPTALAAHRIDKETSGLVLFAKNAPTNNWLQAAFEQGRVQKYYRALVWGAVSWETMTCDLPLLADGNRQHQTRVSHKHGKPSSTLFKRLSKLGPCCLLEAQPHSGRTHQIRVHATELGFPLVGDSLYGGRPLLLSQIKRRYRGDQAAEQPLLARTALHAYRLVFAHPDSQALVDISLDDPADLAAALRQLERLT